jgi:dUTPase
MADRLEEMFTLQLDLQNRVMLEQTLAAMDTGERIAYIKENVLAAFSELNEVLNEIGWKSWASSKHINSEAYVKEIIDLWHFMMNMLLALGVSPAETATLFHTRYLEKRGVNEKRQVEGYDGVKTKCPHCKRDLEEVEVGFSRLLNGQLDQLWCGGCEQVLNWMDLPPRVQENLA